MSDKICPLCQQELYYLGEDIYYCPNHEKYMGSEELWQELIRTRKALDVAVDALKEIKDGKIPVSLGIGMDINDALEQITSLTKGDDNE